MRIFLKCIQYTIHLVKTQIEKKYLSDKINGTTNSVFSRELQLIRVLLLICDSYKRWSTRFFSLKLCAAFSIFSSVSFLSMFIFLFNNIHGLDFNQIPDRLFRGCSRMGVGAKRLPLPKICHAYPTMMKLCTVMPYLKKIEKLYHVTHSMSPANISSFLLEISKFGCIKKHIV